jgi:hypothetical protein
MGLPWVLWVKMLEQMWAGLWVYQSVERSVFVKDEMLGMKLAQMWAKWLANELVKQMAHWLVQALDLVSACG